MTYKITNVLQEYRSRLEGTTSLGSIAVEHLDTDVYRLSPKTEIVTVPDDKDQALTLMAITHGNEVGGIAVINHFLKLLENRIVTLTFPITVVLGNVEAALQSKRFLERDLNRTFGRSTHDTKEDRRARILEPILAKSMYFIDFHQTIEPSNSPFLIFPYQKPSFEFGRQVAPDVPIVTHWGNSFSKDGLCSDEYVNRNGGVGITIELGQKGFSNYQESMGLRIILQALTVLHRKLTGLIASEPLDEGEIYTWAEVIPFPEEEAGLDEGWYNFKWVEKGQRLGFKKGGEILAGTSGPILFPKYPASPDEPKPKELCRIMKRVRLEDLGQD